MQILRGSAGEPKLKLARCVRDRSRGVVFTFISLLAACMSATPGSGSAQQGSISGEGTLPDSLTALSVGQSVLEGVLGAETVSAHSPLVAAEVGGTWVITGRVLPGWAIPAITLELSRSDARVIQLLYSGQPSLAPMKFSPDSGFVQDEETAAQIALAVLMPVYGPAAIERQKPLVSTIDGDIWTVKGQLPSGVLGGVASVDISRTDGRIIRMAHSR